MLTASNNSEADAKRGRAHPKSVDGSRIMLSIKVRTDPLNLEQRISELPRILRKVATEAASVYLIGNTRRGLKRYPPKRARQKYIRTFKLREGWVFEWNSTRSKVVNRVKYAPYVHGDNDQAWMHVGRWWKVGEVIEKDNAGMLIELDKAVEKEIKQRGL